MDSDVSESSESEVAISDSDQSNGPLQHLEDAETVEFEIRDEEPGVKYTTDGRAGWTPISIRNRFSTKSDEYDVKYLRRCKQIRIYNPEKAIYIVECSGGTSESNSCLLLFKILSYHNCAWCILVGMCIVEFLLMPTTSVSGSI